MLGSSVLPEPIRDAPPLRLLAGMLQPAESGESCHQVWIIKHSRASIQHVPVNVNTTASAANLTLIYRGLTFFRKYDSDLTIS